MTWRLDWRESFREIGLGGLVEATENGPRAGDLSGSNAVPATRKLEAAEQAYEELCLEFHGTDADTACNLHLAAAAVFELAGEHDREMVGRRRNARLWRERLPGVSAELLR